MAALHDDLDWPRSVSGRLHTIRSDAEDALQAASRDDWVAVLKVVRMIQGEATVARLVLERRLGPDAIAADLPPLVHVAQMVRQLISEEEIDRLPPVELRAMMHTLLRALDDELRAFVQPPEDSEGS